MKKRLAYLLNNILFVIIIIVLLNTIYIQTASASESANQTIDHEIGNGTTSSGQTFYYVKDEVIVRYKPGIYNNSVMYHLISSEINHEINATIVEDYGSMGLPGMQLILLSENTTPERAIAFYQNISYVDYAQYNYVENSLQPVVSDIKTQGTGTLLGGSLSKYPNDPYFNQQWYLQKIDAPDAWGITTGSSDFEIAVLDSGIDITHPDLTDNIDKANASSSFIDSHGTACAGVLAARGNNGIGISGVMWHAKIVPVVVEDSNGYIFSNYVISGVYRAHQYGARIISCSIGFSSNDLAMQDAFANSDALVICAAGNSGGNNDRNPIYPASYNLNNIISVAGTDENDNLALFPGEGSSNYGVVSVDLAAPAVPILTTVPRNNYDEWEGTSFSAPLVAGVAGLIKSKHPELTNAQIKAAILNNVDKVNSLNGKVVTGGRLNAYKALKSLETPTPTPTLTPTPTTTPTASPTVTPSPTTTIVPTTVITTVPTTPIPTSPVPTQTQVSSILPVSLFSAAVTQGGAPLSVRFTDCSKNYPTKWSWDFGDGTSSTDENPVHTYTHTGVYTVRLSVFNSAGGNGLTKWNYITVSGSAPVITPTATPTASPTITPTKTPTTTPTVSPTVTPSPTTTIVPTTVITTVPTTSIPTSPVPTQTQVSRIPPVSSFSASVTQGGAPLTVRFTDSSTCYPTQWRWDFGDGASSGDQNPVHTYSQSGIYSVRLSVFNTAGGNGLTKWNYIVVLKHS